MRPILALSLLEQLRAARALIHGQRRFPSPHAPDDVSREQGAASSQTTGRSADEHND